MTEPLAKVKEHADGELPASQATPVPAPAPLPEKPKSWWDNTREGFQNMMPQWWRDNSSRINQLGLMTGTAVIMGSVLRGKKISKDIFEEQVNILKAESEALLGHKLEGAALEAKIAELKNTKDPLLGTIMKEPKLHMQRLQYLGTAVTGLGIGGFIKDKETKEDRAKRKPMGLPEYMAMRLGQAFDPLHHSRQTAGVVGASSGVLAILSAFSQPGGVLLSEAFVGATLVAGFTGLTFVDDPDKAKEALNVCWATRLPFVISGTYETLFTKPKFPHPLAEQLKQTTAYRNGVFEAMKDGVEAPRWALGLGKNAAGKHITLAGVEKLFEGKAAEAFSKGHLSRFLKYNRMDVSYPIGQWFNMAMAGIGFLMAGADTKKQQAEAGTTVDVSVLAPDEKHPPTVGDTNVPANTIKHHGGAVRLMDQPELAKA